MLTAELVLATLAEMECKVVLLEMNCEEIITLSKKYSVKQIALATQMQVFTDSARKTCDELFLQLRDDYNKLHPSIWVAVKVAGDSWLKEISQMNAITESIINGTQINYIKDSKGNLVAIESIAGKSKDGINQPLWKTALKGLFNPFNL